MFQLSESQNTKTHWNKDVINVAVLAFFLSGCKQPNFSTDFRLQSYNFYLKYITLTSAFLQ